MGNPEDDDDFSKSVSFQFLRPIRRTRRSAPPIISRPTPDEKTWGDTVKNLETYVFGIDLEPIQPTLVKANTDTSTATKSQTPPDAKVPPQPIENEQA